jgi:hypothetical protein
MKDEDKKLNELYQEYWQFTSNLLDSYKPLEIAGVMMAQAMTMYKTVLAPEDFKNMVDSIVNLQDDVKPLDIPTLQ